MACAMGRCRLVAVCSSSPATGPRLLQRRSETSQRQSVQLDGNHQRHLRRKAKPRCWLDCAVTSASIWSWLQVRLRVGSANGRDAMRGTSTKSRAPPQTPAHLASCLRIDSSSLRRALLVSGYANCIFSKVSRTIRETIKRAFSLSSAGTTYQGVCSVLVALKQAS